jgi:RNA polymerase sigma-70 factor (ECF subfamily)
MAGAIERAAPADDEARLLAGARRLEGLALARIHDRYYPGVYRYLLFRTREELVAEDLASEVFMRLLDSLKAGKPIQALQPWLFGVANHLATDHFRGQARRPQVELSDELVAAGDEHDPEQRAAINLTSHAVRRALGELTEEQQQVLALRFGEGQSVADTAGRMRKSVTAVKQLQFRAVAALRRKLEGFV